jgi:hypothetical protein
LSKFAGRRYGALHRGEVESLARRRHDYTYTISTVSFWNAVQFDGCAAQRERDEPVMVDVTQPIRPRSGIGQASIKGAPTRVNGRTPQHSSD